MMLGTNRGTDETCKRIPTNSVGVELGVWKGESSLKFLTRAGHLHLVDTWSVIPYEDSDEFGDYDGYLTRYEKLVGSRDPKEFQRYYNEVFAFIATRLDGKPVTFHRCTTNEFFATFTGQVDWVYVDALHSFEGCLSDLRNSLKIVKPGGFIFGDDYGNKPGVVKAVDQFIIETGFQLEVFSGNQFQIQVP